MRIGVGLEACAADRITFDQRHVLGARRQQAQSEEPATGIQIDDGPVGDERHHVMQKWLHEKPAARENARTFLVRRRVRVRRHPEPE